VDGVDRERSMVVVPQAAGPLIRPENVGRRSRDDLDQLIDDLLPDSDGGPTWFDGVLLAGGAGLLIWALATGGPGAAVVIAVIMLTLGCMLPLRSLVRRAGERRRQAALQRGVPLAVDDPSTARLVEAYESLLALPGVESPGVAAAHAAVLEAATLLGGRAVDTDRERAYVDARTEATLRLTAALQLPPSPGVALDGGRSDALVEAREELEQISGVNSLTRLDELTAEARGGDGGAG
jgi:hypothetical protein